MAMGAVRSTAFRVQLWGSSNPNRLFVFWNATSIDQRPEYPTRVSSELEDSSVVKNAWSFVFPAGSRTTATLICRSPADGHNPWISLTWIVFFFPYISMRSFLQRTLESFASWAGVASFLPRFRGRPRRRFLAGAGA